jgi:Transposase DDE domain group 1
LRPGNAGSNTAADHVELLGMALDQLPADPAEVEVIARADSAALTHGFIDACRAAQVRFSVGHDLTEPIRAACLSVPGKRWEPAITSDGSDVREGAEVAEITDLVDLSCWPQGTRAVARREQPHPGAQLTFTDIDGHRFQVFITDLADDDITYLEALQRGRGRAEKLICNLKDTGLTNLPSSDMAINAAWMTTALIAHDLLAWARLVALDGDLARAEPKRLRYCLLHAAGMIARSGRRTRLRLAAHWPWAHNLADAFDRVNRLRLQT